MLDLNYLLATTGALSAGIYAFVKYQQSLTERKKQVVDSEVEKEKIRVQGEVDKLKEKSVGGEAVAKMWQEVDGMQTEIERLTDCMRTEVGKLKESQQSESASVQLIKQIAESLQRDMENVKKAFFEGFKRVDKKF